MHLLLQQQQQQQQQQQHHQDGRQAANLNCWNTPNISAIKTEPRDSSPQPFAQYRAPPELTPSPQPLSPTNNYQNHNNHNNNNTPSPFSIATAGTVGSTPNPHMISPNHHFNTGVGATPGPGASGIGHMPNASPMDIHEYAGYGATQHQQQQQLQQQHHQHINHQQHYQGNPFVDAGANQWEEKYVPGSNINDNNIQLSASHASGNHFTMQNLLAGGNGGGGGGGVAVGNVAGLSTHPQHWNVMHNPHHQQHHLQQQQQQQQQHLQQQSHPHAQQQFHQHPDDGSVAAAMPNSNVASNTEHGLSNLLNFDSEQLVRINSEDQQMLRLNSEDLQISNLSIST